MVIVLQITETFPTKVVSWSIPGLLIWGCAVVPTAECSPSGILCRLRYGWYVDCSNLANDPPGIAKACEFGTHQFLEVGCIGGEVDGTM